METEQPVPYAGFWLRFVALIIDGFVIQMIQLIILLVFIIGGFGYLVPDLDLREFSINDDPEIIAAMFIGIFIPAMILSKVMSVLYFTIMEASKYQATLGKMAIGLIVSDVNGNRLDIPKSLLRQIGKIISSMFFYVGYLMAGFTEKKQALHDYMAGALVVKK